MLTPTNYLPIMGHPIYAYHRITPCTPQTTCIHIWSAWWDADRGARRITCRGASESLVTPFARYLVEIDFQVWLCPTRWDAAGVCLENSHTVSETLKPPLRATGQPHPIGKGGTKTSRDREPRLFMNGMRSQRECWTRRDYLISVPGWCCCCERRRHTFPTHTLGPNDAEEDVVLGWVQ